MRSKGSSVIILSVLVFFIHVLALVAVAEVYQANGVDFRERIESQDSGQYLMLAHSLLEGDGFTWEAGHPDSFRTPGYPLFNSFVLAVSGGSFVAWCVSLALLSALLVFPVYGMACKLGFTRYSSLVLAGITGMSPTLLLQTVTGMGADLLYTLLLAVTGFLLLRVRGEYSYRLAIAIGLTFGLAVLVRPVGLYIAPLIILALPFLAPDGSPVSARIRKTLVVGMVCAAVFVPWMVRNYVLFGHFALSSVPTFNIAVYNLPQFLAWEHGTTPDVERSAVFSELENPSDVDLRTFAHSSDVKELAVRMISESGLFTYGYFHLLNTAPFFLGSSVNVMQAIVGREAPSVAKWPLTALILAERFLWGILFLLLFASPFLSHGWMRVFFVFCIALVLANALLSSPVSQARYRLPVEPFVLIAAAYASGTLWKRLVERRGS